MWTLRMGIFLVTWDFFAQVSLLFGFGSSTHPHCVCWGPDTPLNTSSRTLGHGSPHLAGMRWCVWSCCRSACAQTHTHIHKLWQREFHHFQFSICGDPRAHTEHLNSTPNQLDVTTSLTLVSFFNLILTWKRHLGLSSRSKLLGSYKYMLTR